MAMRLLSVAGLVSPVTPYARTTSWTRNAPGSTTYAQAQTICQQSGRRLCTRTEICPNGHQGGETPDGGKAAYDSWVPTSDGENAWVQTGSGYWPSCLMHTEIAGGIHGEPGWGTLEIPFDFRHDICCFGTGTTPSPTPPIAISWTRDAASTTTYSEAQSICELNGGGRLCTRSEICPNGHQGGETPHGGKVPFDSWVPTSDGENAWVQTGSGYWPSCLMHTEIAGGIYGEPGWGTLATPLAFRHDVCCAIPAPDAANLVFGLPESVDGSASCSTHGTIVSSALDANDNTAWGCCSADVGLHPGPVYELDLKEEHQLRGIQIDFAWPTKQWRVSVATSLNDWSEVYTKDRSSPSKFTDRSEFTQRSARYIRVEMLESFYGTCHNIHEVKIAVEDDISKFHVNKIICPFLASLVNEKHLPKQLSYSRAQLQEVTLKSGLHPKLTSDHINGNFLDIPVRNGVQSINIFDMEGNPNEHKTSTGINDCSTTMSNCRMGAHPRSCDIKLEECAVPNKEKFEEFWNAVDVDEDDYITYSELAEAETSKAFPILAQDLNPIGEGTIRGAFSFLIDVAGDKTGAKYCGISKSDLRMINIDRKFPTNFEFDSSTDVQNRRLSCNRRLTALDSDVMV